MSVNNVIAEEKLPAWMKQAKRGVDWGALLIIGFCLVTAWSFLAQSDLPATNDIEAYVYRSADYADAFEQGIFYNRWSPHALNGYGAPIPHYYPSGAAYAGGLISYLFTNNPIVAVRMLFIFSLIVAGSMTYTFVAQRTTALAGMMAALLYVFSPYVMVTVSHIEGDLPLAIGTALLPSLLWAVNRLLKRYQAMDFLLIAVIVAITIFTVPIILFQGIIAVIVLLMVEFRDDPNWEKLITVIGAIVAGVLLSAFYWFPALMQYSNLTWYDSPIAVPQYSLQLIDLLTLPQAVDPGLSIHPSTYHLGWAVLLALLINLPLLIVEKSDRWLSTSFFILGLVLLVLVLLLTPEKSSWLVLILFCFSITGSYIGQRMAKRSAVTSILLWSIVIFTFVSSAMLWIVPEPDLVIGEISPAAQVNYEQSGYGYVGLPSGLPLPSHLAPSNASVSFTSESYAETIPRLRNSQVVSPVTNESSYVGRYTVSSDESIFLIYNRAYFESWQAIMSGGNLIVSESERKLIQVSIPANESDSIITFRLGLTPLTASAWTVTLVAFILCLIFWWHRWQQSDFDYDESILLSKRSSTLFLALLLALVAIRGSAVTLFRSFFVQSAQYTQGSALFVRTDYDRSFQLLAYDLQDDSYSGGDTVELTAYWTISRPVETQYLVRLRITDNLFRNTIYASPYAHAGYYPSNRWQPFNVVPQSYNFRLPHDMDAGTYSILFDVYACSAPCSADIMNFNPAQGQIRILRPITVD